MSGKNTKKESSKKEPINCKDNATFFENSAGGNCMYDSIAQLWLPYSFNDTNTTAKQKKRFKLYLREYESYVLK
jgi:hypothetical protein